MVLIITNKVDPHCDAVVRVFNERGVDFERFNTEDFLNSVKIDWKLDKQGINGVLDFVGGRKVLLSSVGSCWYRRPEPPNVSKDLFTSQSREFAKDESQTFLRHLWEFLSDKYWINQPLKIRHAESKINNLFIASRMGFSVPRTLVTTNPGSARQFWEHCKGNVITKVIGRGQVEYFEDHYYVYAHRVNDGDILELESVKYSPTLFQEYVPKSVEIRVTVVGSQVFSCEIHSQDSLRTKDDWRRYDFEHVKHAIHDLPQSIQKLCLRLVSELGLNFATIDLILTPDGQYVFLELNPNGQWLWIEDLTGLPISSAIADLLIDHDK